MDETGMSGSAKETCVELPTPRGVLRGVRHTPGASADAGWSAIILHGYFSCTHVGPARLYVDVARLLARLGVETWRVGCLGVGDSDGRFEDCTYASQFEDYRTLIGHVRAGAKRLALLGHSLGASMAIRLAAEDPAIERLLLVSPACGAFSNPDALFTAEQRADLRDRGVTERKGVLIRGDFVDAMTDPGVYEVAGEVTTPTAIFHGSRDEFFDAGSIKRLTSAMPHARLVQVEGADHNSLLPGSRRRFLEHFEQGAREVLGVGG